MTATSGSRRVVIVGGGFAGPFAAWALRRRERTFTVDDTPVPSGAYGDPGEAGHPADTAK